MKCRYCGNPISPDAKKCPSCLWEGDDLAVEDNAEIKKEEAEKEPTTDAQDSYFEPASNEPKQSEENVNEEPKEEKAPDNIVMGLTKKEFFDFYIPEKIRSNALWAVYLLFFSALANCVSALYDFYFGLICSAVCLVLAIAIKKTLSIGPAIGACVFTILLTIINFIVAQTITGWIAIVASVFCCTSLNKFNSLWTIYTATSKVPTLDPMDKARADARREKKNKKVGWVVFYVALALCLVGVIVHYVFALTYISKFDYGVTEGNHYSNEFVDVDMTLDSDWTVFDKKQLAELNLNVYGIEDSTAVDTQYLLYATTETDEVVLIESLFLESMLYSSERLADEYEDSYKYEASKLERQDPIEYNGNVYEVIYLEYKYQDTDEGGNTVDVVYYEKLLARTEGSYSFSIYISTTESAERLEEICAMLFGEVSE